MILNFEKIDYLDYFCKDYNLLISLSEYSGAYIDSYSAWILSDVFIDISIGFSADELYFSTVSHLSGSSAQNLYSNFLEYMSGISSFYQFELLDSSHVYFHLKESSLPDNFSVNLSFDKIGSQSLSLKPVSDFDTDLYSELLDNSEQFQLAKSFLNDTDPQKELDPTYWTDIQLKFFKFVEEYNKNVLSLRATKKVDANVNGSISQSGQSDIDLSPVVQQLSNLNNKLQRVDENQETKNITQTINDLSLSNQTVITTVESAPYNPLLDDGSDIDF